LAILARWRSDHHDHACSLRRQSLVEDALQVAEPARKRVVGHDAQANLVGDGDDRARPPCQRSFERIDLAVHVCLRQHAVREPKRQAVDEHWCPCGHFAERAGEIVRRFDGLPACPASCHVLGDARGHLFILSLGRRHIEPGARQRLDQALGVAALA
jgi:hypothetical protein